MKDYGKEQEYGKWLTQKAIGELFDIDRTVVTKHIKNIYSEFELDEDSTSANFALVQKGNNVL